MKKNRTSRFRIGLWILATILVQSLFLVPAGHALAADLSQGVGPPDHLPVRGERAIQVLGERLPDVAKAYGLSNAQLLNLFRTDDTLAVDANGELLYIDEAFPGDAAANAEEMSGQSVAQASGIPELNSLPGANHTIYLDFDGHVTENTSWNNGYGVSVINSPAYSLDGDPAFSATELTRIQTVWEWVAEDFRPFQVNVTTIDPGSAALSYQGSGDTQWGVRVVMTNDTFANCGCGGHAYIGSFDDTQDEPVFVYNKSQKGVSEAATHEVGHAMLLAHDGTSTVTYYSGHGSGATSWGTLMGASYSPNVTQWSVGEYFDANNTSASANYGNGPEDLAIIASLTNGNGFGYRPDDHGNTIGTASTLGGTATTVNATGIVEQNTDVDFLRFVTGAGTVSLSVTPALQGANLDVLADLYDSNGTLIATSNPASILSASFNVTLTAGEYFLAVQGTGTGAPLANPPSGYTAYGSIGAYTVSGTVVDPDGLDLTPPTAPSGLSATASNGTVDLTWTANTEPDLAGYTVYRSTSSGGPYTTLTGSLLAAPSYTDATASNGTTYFYVVSASDGNGNESSFSAQASATPTDPSSPDLTNADFATGAGSLSGTFAATHTKDGAVQSLTETHSGGKPANRHDLAEHTWIFNVTNGNHIFWVDAFYADAGDGDSGFRFEWSQGANGPWSDLVVVNTTSASDGYLSADMGGPSGTIYVRATDLDRTSGQNNNDTLFVDHMFITGGAPPADPPAPANSPDPADGATGVSLTPTLSWASGLGATSHDVYFGTGSPPTLVGNQSDASYAPGTLDPNTTYFWRIDEVNSEGKTTGAEWSFTTQDSPSSVQVQSIVLGIAAAEKGNKFGQATVIVADDYGNLVVGVTVNGQFSGDFAESPSAITDGNGEAVLTTAGSTKKPAFTFCVISLSHPSLSDDTTSPVCQSYQ